VTSILPVDTFADIVKYAPLVSIDFIVRNGVGDVLLGRRLNRPAQGYWFVPGGRILKGERLEDAFLRLTKVELGTEQSLSGASFLGIFEHFYDDNFLNENFSTHYVVIGYSLVFPVGSKNSFPREQHTDYKWFSTDEIIQSDSVHKYTKLYFSKGI